MPGFNGNIIFMDEGMLFKLTDIDLWFRYVIIRIFVYE